MPAKLLFFKDPEYDGIDRSVEQRLGLPDGLLGNIRTKGERSNADQVSSAGAKSVYQITPRTRQLVLRKYGVDAYLGPQQAALAAGHILKEGIERNGGDAVASVREYIGGTDRRNHGPVTAAYVRRVTGKATPAAPVTSTFDRVRAQRQAVEDQAPSIAKVYTAYKSGRMPQAERAQFEADVNSGAVLLPRGASVRAAQRKAQELPAGVVAAYNSGEMPAEAREELDRDVKAGLVRAPGGTSLKAPAARSASEGVGLGVRNVATMLAGWGDVAAGGVNAVVNALPGTQGLAAQPFRDITNRVADAIGLPKPRDDNERLIQAITEGAGSGILTAGAGIAASGARGIGGVVARALAANPLRDVISGAAGGAGAYYGEEVGGTPGALIGGLVGGAAGAAGAASVAERLAARFPKAAMIDASGNLTENGRELAQRSGVGPAEVQTAYARARTSTGPRSPIRAPEEAAAARTEASAKARAAVADPETARTLSERPATPPAPPRTTDAPDLPAATDRIVAAMGDRIPPPPREASAPVGEGPTNANFAEAQSEGVRLTRGQAEQDFSVQNDENSLRTAASNEGERTRQFFDEQQQQIQGATYRFREGFGNLDATPEERGAQVKQALSDLRDAGTEGVSRMYREAEAMGGEGLRLETDGIKTAAQDILIDEATPEPVKRAVSQELARYGLIGESAPVNEAGITRVTLDDGSSVSFRGPVKELTVANAESLRKAVNRLYDPTRPNLSAQSLKPVIDDAVESAIERAAQGSPEAGAANGYREARASYREQKETFAAKDVVQKLIDNKRGTGTPLTLPQRAVAAVLGTGPNDVADLRKVKGLLLSSSGRDARQAWQAVQAQGLADIFDKAVNIQTGTISGTRLNTAINKFGTGKLRILLDTPDYNQLMKLRRIVHNATVPLPNTTNPSGTFTKLANFLGKGALRFTGGFGDAALALVGKARELAATRKTLEGITSYDGNSATSRRLDQQARDFVAQYIADGKAGRLMPASINLGAAAGRQTNTQEPR
jgi:hypothetical protein